MSKINTAPRGLQSLLGNVNQGDNPSELLQGVSPVVDLEKYWQLQKQKHITAADSFAPSTEGTVELVVPQGEQWVLVAASFFVSVALNFAYYLELAIVSDAATVPVAVATNQMNKNENISTGKVSVGHDFARQTILPSGWRIVGKVSSSSDTTSRVAAVQAIYIRLGD